MIKKFKNGKLNDFLSQHSKDFSLQKKPDTDFLELGRWLNIIKHPSVILIVGHRGSGKSALGYKLLEYLRWKGQICVVGLPQKARKPRQTIDTGELDYTKYVQSRPD